MTDDWEQKARSDLGLDQPNPSPATKRLLAAIDGDKPVTRSEMKRLLMAHEDSLPAPARASKGLKRKGRKAKAARRKNR